MLTSQINMARRIGKSQSTVTEKKEITSANETYLMVL